MGNMTKTNLSTCEIKQWKGMENFVKSEEGKNERNV